LKTFELNPLVDELLHSCFDVFNDPSETGEGQRLKRLNFLNPQRRVCSLDHQSERTVFLKTQAQNVTVKRTRPLGLRRCDKGHDIRVREQWIFHAKKITQITFTYKCTQPAGKTMSELFRNALSLNYLEKPSEFEFLVGW